MSSTELLTKTLENGIFDESGPDSLRLNDEFATRLDGLEDELADRSDESVTDRLEPLVPDAELEQFTEIPRDAVAMYLAVAEYAETVSHDERLRLLTAIDQVRRGSPPDAGSPDPFLPVHGDRLDLLFPLHSPAVVYVWLDDCGPCDVMKDEFEDLFPSTPTDVSLLSVYGPDWAPHLQTEYDITGGPTTLFVTNGSIETRLYGAQYREALEREINRLKDSS